MSDWFPLSLSREFQIETSQIQFWINALNDIKTQFSSLLHITRKQCKYIITFGNSLATNIKVFYTACTEQANDPSNWYKLTSILWTWLESNSNSITGGTNATLPILENEIPNLISTINVTNDNIIKTSQSIMEEISSIKAKYNEITEKYNQSRQILDDAHKKKKLVENDPLTAYDDKKKEKAENEEIMAVKVVENIMPHVKNYSKQWERKQEIFNTHMKETFELVVMNVFKGIVHLNQLFWILAKQRYDNHIDLRNLLVNKISKEIRANSIVSNDYSERKYSISQLIYYEPIHFTHEHINIKENKKNSTLKKEEIEKNICVKDLSNSYIQYINSFNTCSQIRKAIIKAWIDFIESTVKAQNQLIGKWFKVENKISNAINIFNENNNWTYGIRKTWSSYLSFWNGFKVFHNDWMKYSSTQWLHVWHNYVSENREDFNKFNTKWNKFKTKISGYMADHSKLEKKNDCVKLSELEQKIQKYLNKNCYEFIYDNVQQLRVRDNKRNNDIMIAVEYIYGQYEKKSDDILDLTKRTIDNVTTSDWFEDVKEMFIKYFERYEILNYDSFMESMKLKILTKIDFENEQIGQNTKQFFSVATFNKDNNITNNTNNINLINNGLNINLNSHSFLSNNEDFAEIRSTNELNLSLNNNENIGDAITCANIANSNKIKQTPEPPWNPNMSAPNKELSSGDESKVIDRFKYSKQDSIVNNIQFVNKDNFEVLDHKKINPYNDFKESEWKRIMTKVYKVENTPSVTEYIDQVIKKDTLDEILIDKYNCIYKQRIEKSVKHYTGKLYITSVKIVFQKPKTQISIPLVEITGVNKVNNERKKISYIELKTKKTTLWFCNFEDREKCITAINNQIHLINNIEEINVEAADNISGNSKYTRQLHQRSIEISKMLSKIRFYERLKEITNRRITQFENEYKDWKDNLYMWKPEQFHSCFINDELISTSPISFVYDTLLNPDACIEELGKDKGFFESIYVNRGDLNMELIKNDTSDGSEIPKFYDDIDYSNILFTNIEEEDWEEFLNDVDNWPNSTTYEMNFVHLLPKMVVGPDRITMHNILKTHFISPTWWIVDYLSYGSNFPFADTFVSMTQHRISAEYKFNQIQGVFTFKTKISTYFHIKFIKSCLFEGTVKSEGYKTSEQDIKFSVFESIKMVMENKDKNFNEMYCRLADENIRRNLYKYKGDINMDDIVPIEEEKEEIVDKKENVQVAEVKNEKSWLEKLVHPVLGEVEKNEINMLLIILVILFYFLVKIVTNTTASLFDKLINVLLVIVISGLFVNVVRGKKKD